MSTEPIADAARPTVVNPADPYERRAQTFPRLTDEQVERASELGAVEALRKGTVLFARGDRATDFFIVLEGRIEIYDDAPSGSIVFVTHGVNEFTGDLDLFNDRKILISGRMGATGRVLRIRRPQFRRLLAAEPDIAEIIMRAFILRRVRPVRVARSRGGVRRRHRRRRAGRPGGGGLQRLGRPLHAGARGRGAGRSGRHQLEDRELSRLPDRHLGPALAGRAMVQALIGRISAARAIVLHTETEIVALAGKRHLEEVTWRHRRTGAEETRAISNVFLMLGAVPNTEWLRGCLLLDDYGFVRCGAGFDHSGDWQTDRVPYALESSRRGVFAVGDVRSGSVKRVASAVGEGSIVVSAIHQILAEI